MSDNVFGAPIHTYSRAEAIADGVLHDVSDLATQVGFLHPVAFAPEAWAQTVAWPHDASGQEETGRAWDVLNVAVCALRITAAKGQDSGPVPFTVYRITEPGGEHEPAQLCIEVGPGDDRSPVVTITHARDN